MKYGAVFGAKGYTLKILSMGLSRNVDFSAILTTVLEDSLFYSMLGNWAVPWNGKELFCQSKSQNCYFNCDKNNFISFFIASNAWLTNGLFHHMYRIKCYKT